MYDKPPIERLLHGETSIGEFLKIYTTPFDVSFKTMLLLATPLHQHLLQPDISIFAQAISKLLIRYLIFSPKNVDSHCNTCTNIQKEPPRTAKYSLMKLF